MILYPVQILVKSNIYKHIPQKFCYVKIQVENRVGIFLNKRKIQEMLQVIYE